MRHLFLTAAITLVALPAYAQKDMTPVSKAERGSMVTVQGQVARILDEDTFRLSDSSGAIRVYVGPNVIPAEVGETVTVHGFVDDDPGPREIYARTMTRADGTLVTFDYRY
ncbi:MAG: hypothetical protein LPJ92_03885 [Rhodobacterales bacterium]|nr:hypothetical protein [Rhodobacterales bacterium]MDX5389451.1 hypothetical protein [Rhodobacterales bacterium]MDX5489148.1 hypothetical protein [Rhodobacterales bacterium]